MSESIFIENEDNKSTNFKSNDKLNQVLSELKILLSPVQRQVEQRFVENKWPASFIVGSPRSGTTLVLQWLASLEIFAYPSNVLTRFAFAPYVGALVQKMLFDKAYDFHQELADINSEINFKSNLGKSQGALATSEFQHFFRNYMPNFDPEYLDEKTIQDVDFAGIVQGLASIEEAFQIPVVTKNFMLQYNLTTFYKSMPKSFFLFTVREPIYNMQSILRGRQMYYEDPNIWFSTKPKEYSFLKDMDVYHQIAGQVYFTNQAIESALAQIPETHKLTISYENFCQAPETYFHRLREMYSAYDYTIDPHYTGPDKFKVSNTIKLDRQDINKLEQAYQYFSTQAE